MANDTNTTTAAYTLSAAVAIVFNTLLTWVKETNEAVHEAMVVATGHHWITHGLLVIGLFIILGFLLSRMPSVGRATGARLSIFLTLAVVVGGLGIAGFFLQAL